MGRHKTVEISESQAKTLKAICDYMEEHHLPPTVKELASSLGISHASAHEQLLQLVRKGYIRRDPGKARSIVVMKKPKQ